MSVPTSVKELADEIQRLMQINTTDLLTFVYTSFYELADRDRFKEGFKVDLATRLRERGYLINFGEAVVSVVKDFNSNPPKKW